MSTGTEKRYLSYFFVGERPGYWSPRCHEVLDPFGRTVKWQNVLQRCFWHLRDVWPISSQFWTFLVPFVVSFKVFFCNCHFDTCVFFYISLFITDLFLDYPLLSSFFPLFKCTYYSCEFRVSDPIDCLTLPMIPASMKTTWSSLRSPLKNNIMEFMRPMTAAK